MYIQRCPKCGGIVVKDDMYDTEHNGDSVVELFAAIVSNAKSIISGKVGFCGRMTQK